MPYDLKKQDKGFVVVDDKGKAYSDKPMPKWRAAAQMRALYAAENAKKKELSLQDLDFKIRRAFMDEYCEPPDEGPMMAMDKPESMYPVQIYADHLIFTKEGHFYSLDYTQDKDGVVFAADAQEVESTWAPVPASKAALTKDGLPASCFLVVEDPKKVTTWSLPVKDAGGKADHNLMGAAWAALHGGYRGNKYEGPQKGAAIAKLTALYKAEKMPVPTGKSFSAFKEAGGDWRWVLYSSSAFRDQDGEIVSAQALIDAVDRIDAKESKDYGPLRWWHVGSWEMPDGIESWQTWKAGPGIDLGRCDFSMVAGKMLIESGTFKSAEIGEAISEVADLLGASICFSHPADEPVNKEYAHIHLLERSLLPQAFASNLLTKTIVTKENDMDLKKKLGALSAILKGKPELAQQILADADAIEKAAKDAGLEFKEVSEMIAPTEPEPLAVEPPAAEPPAAEPPAESVEEYIGDWSPSKLQETINQAVTDALKGQSEQAATKEASTIDALNNAIKALNALTGRIEAVESTAASTKQKLDELADARPPKVKEIAANRPTAKEDNVTSNPPAGPQIDPSFVEFAHGGK